MPSPFKTYKPTVQKAEPLNPGSMNGYDYLFRVWRHLTPEKMTNYKLISLASIFLVLFDNFAFFRNVTDVYPVSLNNIAFLCSLTVLLISFIILLFALLGSKYTTKPILIVILLVSSIASYFMNTYNTVIDYRMIQNILETDINETLDLFSFKLFIYLLFLGILPSLYIYKLNIKYRSIKIELLSKLKTIIVTILIIALIIIFFSKFYTSFFREHKPLRYYTNPTYYIYSIGKYINRNMSSDTITLMSIGEDAEIPITDTDRELIILVVGEAARADRMSLNGYKRETNPLLKKEDIINFPNMYSCGTSTAVSVPCMFSIFKKDEYSNKKANSTQNILDVLSRVGVNILWRDNNSSSKGVASMVAYENYKSPKNNPICDVECRDEGMLVGLQEYINSQKHGDILIVLHQRGNHGPAYYKRYPKLFEKFTPTCKTNQLEKCTKDEIGNAYDNSILYTDYFLSKVIKLLKQNTNHFETAMLYLSDHGESLGENNLYLHGLPYFIAPETQKHIAAIMWFGDSFKIDKDTLKKKAIKRYSQDNLFHTLLGLMEVNTSVYDKNMDIINDDK